MMYQSFFALAAESARKMMEKVINGIDELLEESFALRSRVLLCRINFTKFQTTAISNTGNHHRKKVFRKTRYRKSNRQTILLQLLSPNSPWSKVEKYDFSINSSNRFDSIRC